MAIKGAVTCEEILAEYKHLEEMLKEHQAKKVTSYDIQRFQAGLQLMLAIDLYLSIWYKRCATKRSQAQRVEA